MYILYYTPTCPFCIRVLDFAKEAEITLTLKNINEEQYAQELMERGGKTQVPYFVDEEEGREMYESSDIIGYLTLKEI